MGLKKKIIIVFLIELFEEVKLVDELCYLL